LFVWGLLFCLGEAAVCAQFQVGIWHAVGFHFRFELMARMCELVFVECVQVDAYWAGLT
jgi:hypothetical protein